MIRIHEESPNSNKQLNTQPQTTRQLPASQPAKLAMVLEIIRRYGRASLEARATQGAQTEVQ